MKKMGRKRMYTDEERKIRHNEAVKKWKENNPQMEKANSILQNYKRNDKMYNRGECTITSQWIVENIFSQPCAHCGETDWNKLGCNRIDNSKPHTIDNVEPCCEECNLNLVKPKKPLNQINAITGEVVRTWESVNECERNGYNKGHVAACCRGVEKTYKGFKWTYLKTQ